MKAAIGVVVRVVLVASVFLALGGCGKSATWTVDGTTKLGASTSVGAFDLDALQPLASLTQEQEEKLGWIYVEPGDPEVAFQNAKIVEEQAIGRADKIPKEKIAAGLKFTVKTPSGKVRAIEVLAYKPGDRSQASITLKISE